MRKYLPENHKIMFLKDIIFEVEYVVIDENIIW